MTVDRNLRIRMLLEAGDRVTGPLRDIAGGSTRAARALGLTRDKLKEIQRAQGDIAGFRALKAGLHATGSQMHAAQQRASALGREMAQTATPTKALARDFARAKGEAGRLARQHQAETRELGQLRDRLRAAGVATGDLARHERDLRTSARQTNAEITDQERRLSRLADRERRMATARDRFARVQGMATGLAAGGAAGIGTGMVMAAPLIGSIRAAREYEWVMTDIGQKADLSRAASNQLGRNLIVAARAANQMPADLQAGVDALAGLGARVPDAVRMMKPIGRAATAYKAEIADLSAAALAATDNLKVPVAQTGRIIDVMASAGKAGAFEIKDMAQYFPALTAAYQGLGQTGVGAVADLAAGLQIARKGAGDAASAGTNLANVLQKIASPATNRAFAKLGVDLPAALKKAYAEGKTPLEAIAELTNKTLKGDLSKLGYLFEDAQVQQGLRPLIQNMQEFRRIRADASKASGTTDRDFADRMKDSAEQSKQLKINATTLAITLGSQLLPTVNAVVEKANAFATWIGDIANRYPNATRAIAIGAAGFAALFLVLGGGAIVIAGLVAPFAALTFAAGALNIAMLPMIGIALGVVAGVVAIGAAAYLIYHNWGAIGGWFAGLWRGIKATVAGTVDWFAALPTRFATIGRDMMTGLIRGIFGMIGALKNTIVGVASSAANWFRAKLGIHSPSRVFMGFGGNIVDGLTNGIAAQEGEPVRRMDRLSNRLSSAIVTGSAIPALALGTPANAGAAPGPPAAAPRSYTFHINQQPGQDAQALARAVADEIDRREREADARRRSSFADRPDWETV